MLVIGEYVMKVLQWLFAENSSIVIIKNELVQKTMVWEVDVTCRNIIATSIL